MQQRIFGLICGYADCNDAARLADDPVHKLLLDRDPLTGPALASQATLSRFENAVAPLMLTRLGHALADLVIAQQRARRQGRARRITIDFDPTDDPTHGQQEFTFFNGHYDTWCYLPLLGFVSFDDEAEQYGLLALLRPGNSRRQARRDPLPAAPVPEAAGGLSRRAAARAPGRRLRRQRPAGVPGGRAGRVRGGPRPQSPVGQTRPAASSGFTHA